MAEQQLWFAGKPEENFGLALASDTEAGVWTLPAKQKKIAFDRIGNGEKVLLISGFPQTRISWNRLTPLLSNKFQAIPADLPSFGDSGFFRHRRQPKMSAESSTSSLRT